MARVTPAEKQARPIEAADQLEGYDAKRNELGVIIYHCVESRCDKTYRYKGAAKQHAEYHKAQKDNPIEELKVELAKEEAEEATGGEVLRELADQIEKGVLNIPDLIWKLRLCGSLIDGLLREIKGADIRLLSKKARAFDVFVSEYEYMKANDMLGGEEANAAEQG